MPYPVEQSIFVFQKRVLSAMSLTGHVHTRGGFPEQTSSYQNQALLFPLLAFAEALEVLVVSWTKNESFFYCAFKILADSYKC